jgi:hypothetical protein
MEFVSWLFFAILTGLATAQIYDSGPRIARWLIAWAVARLPGECAPRMHEEWLAHLNACEGKMGMVAHGIGCVVASFKFRHNTNLELAYVLCRIVRLEIKCHIKCNRMCILYKKTGIKWIICHPRILFHIKYSYNLSDKAAIDGIAKARKKIAFDLLDRLKS